MVQRMMHRMDHGARTKEQPCLEHRVGHKMEEPRCIRPHLLLAAAFLLMGAVGLDIGKWFVQGALALGVGVALLLRFTRKT